jgi:hypothetical protein
LKAEIFTLILFFLFFFLAEGVTDFNPILYADEMKVYYARHTKDMRVVQSDGTVVFYILEKYTLGICKTFEVLYALLWIWNNLFPIELCNPKARPSKKR